MDYAKQLLKAHNRQNTDSIAFDIGDSAVKLQKIISIVYNTQPPLPQRAAWVLSAVNEKRSHMLIPHLPLFIDTINDFKIDGIKRNMIGILAKHFLPEHLHGKLIDLCFKFMNSSDETVVVKTEAMQCIANLLPLYPELTNEFKAVIKNELPKTTAAFHSRAKHILRAV